MAIDLTQISYCPKRDTEWFIKALFSTNTANYIKIYDNVKEKLTLNLAQSAGKALVPDSSACGFNPNADVKFSEALLEVFPFKMHFDECLKNLEGTWLSDGYLRPGASLSEAMPDEIAEIITEIVLNQIQSDIEDIIWNSVASTNSPDGLLTIIKNASDSVKVAGVSITRANVIGELEKVYSALDFKIKKKYKKEDLKFFIDGHTEEMLQFALADVSNQVIAANFYRNDDVMTFMGIEIVVVSALAEDTIVLSNRLNLVYGTDLTDDRSYLEVGHKPFPNNDEWAAKLRIKLGFAVIYTDEVVLYQV